MPRAITRCQRTAAALAFHCLAAFVFIVGRACFFVRARSPIQSLALVGKEQLGGASVEHADILVASGAKPHGAHVEPLPWMWQVVMRRDFKWGYGPQPRWSSVGRTANTTLDVLSCHHTHDEGVLAASTHDLSFLRKLETRKWNDIRFYDLNVNELTKLTIIIEYILSTDFEHFDGFASVRQLVSLDPTSFYIPGFLGGKAELQHDVVVGDYSRIVWVPESKASYQLVQKQLRHKVNPFYDVGCPGSKPIPHVTPKEFNFPTPLQPLHPRWTLKFGLPFVRQSASMTPVWGAVFAASNDVIEGVSALGKCLFHTNVEARHLVTVVGGMKFLDLLEDTLYGRITFFDLNVNEASKLYLAIQYILNTPYDQYDGMIGLDAFIRTHANSFFLPLALRGKAQMVASDTFTFPYRGRNEPLWSILSPSKYPEYMWKPRSKETYERVQENLRNHVDAEFQLGFASVKVSPNSAVVYFSSHVPHKVESQIRGVNIRKVPIWSSLATFDAKTNLKNIGNAHSWWQFKVSSFLKGTSLHVWGVSDRALLNRQYQKPYYTAGDVADAFVKRDPTQMTHYDTTVLHIFLAKPKTQCDVHTDMLLKSISQCCTMSKRVIISDANKDSGVFDSGHPCLPTLSALRDMVAKELLKHGFEIKFEDYSCGDARFGGDKTKGVVTDRNVFFIAERV